MADKTPAQKKANKAASIFGGLIKGARLSIYNREDDIDTAVDQISAGKDANEALKIKRKKRGQE